MDSGLNHTAVTLALHLQRAFQDVVVFLVLTVTAYSYFLEQNAAILDGTVEGVNINLKVLGIGNGITVRHQGCLASRRAANSPNQDALSQYPGYIQYAESNPYHPLVNSSVLEAANTAWSQEDGCRDQVSLSFYLTALHIFKKKRRSSPVTMGVAIRSALRP